MGHLVKSGQWSVVSVVEVQGSKIGTGKTSPAIEKIMALVLSGNYVMNNGNYVMNKLINK
jgi:hypothetical protein